MADTQHTASLEGLSDDQIRKVLDHIARLRAGRSAEVCGSAGAVLRLAGTWWMDPGETGQFLREVVALRNMSNGEREVSL